MPTPPDTRSAGDRPHKRPRPEDPDLWSKSGVFARHYPGYEPRAPQKAMYEAVLETLAEGGHLVIEAGTGTGKGMAYLAPVIMLAAQNPQTKFVVTTNTINLQQQLVEKDIPHTLAALEKAGLVGPGQFTYATLKGRNNYLCHQNFEAFEDQNGGRGWEEADRLIDTVARWPTATGDRSEINVAPAQEVPWNRISASHHAGCPYYQASEPGAEPACFLKRARHQAQQANLVVANHALFLADLANSENQLGHTTHVIIDESHHLETAASSQFGWELSEKDAGSAGDDLKDDPVLGQAASAMGRAWHAYWQALAGCVKPPRYDDETVTAPIDPRLRNSLEWHEARQQAQELDQAMTHLLESVNAEVNRAVAATDPNREVTLRPVQSRCSEHRKQIRELMDRHDPEHVRWLEVTTRYGAVVKSIPLNVAPILRQQLFDRKVATILTSATLAAGDRDFSLFRSRVGFPAAGREIALESPFNYRRQALFMSPVDIPAPNDDDFADALAECLADLGAELQGHTLALFTSYAALHGAAKRIRGPLAQKGIAVMAQGRDGAPSQILDRFRSDPRAVILGTASFWEGVDLSHEVLKAVAICRLPFPVPTDPVIKARSDTFADPFNEYHTPMAVLRFRQGCGRLIRNKHSKGAIIILDSRIRNQNYGMKFFRSLPRCSAAKSFVHNVGRLAREWAAE